MLQSLCLPDPADCAADRHVIRACAHFTIGRFLSALHFVTNTRLAKNDAVSNSRKEGAGQLYLEVDGVKKGQAPR